MMNSWANGSRSWALRPPWLEVCCYMSKSFAFAWSAGHEEDWCPRRGKGRSVQIVIWIAQCPRCLFLSCPFGSCSLASPERRECRKGYLRTRRSQLVEGVWPLATCPPRSGHSCWRGATLAASRTNLCATLAIHHQMATCHHPKAKVCVPSAPAPLLADDLSESLGRHRPTLRVPVLLASMVASWNASSVYTKFGARIRACTNPKNF